MILNEGTRVVVDGNHYGILERVVDDNVVIVKFHDEEGCSKVEACRVKPLLGEEILNAVTLTEEEFKKIVAEKAEIAADGNDVMSVCLRLFGASIGAAIFGEREP